MMPEYDLRAFIRDDGKDYSIETAPVDKESGQIKTKCNTCGHYNMVGSPCYCVRR